MESFRLNDEFYLSEEAPSGGIDRQQFYINKLKLYIEEYKAKNGKNLTYSIETFGCQMNFHDSEKLEGILENIGYKKADSNTADLIIFNTCTIRENANLKLYGHLGTLKKRRLASPDMMIGICGCMMQEPTVIENIKTKYKYVDLVFGTFNFHKVAEIIFKRISTGKQVIEIEKEAVENVENLPSKRKYEFKSGLNIMYGCNNFCTYCIVPYVRGRERSRTPEDILEEARRLAADGVKEIMLLGQNVNSYGTNFLAESDIIKYNPDYSFPELLDDICKIPEFERVRFMTSHPKDLSDKLIDVISRNKNVCRSIHLPVQSGSNDVLRRMNRKYTRESYLVLLNKLKDRIPDVSITTDIIVGFPGETDADFEDTLSLVEMAGYDQAFTFIYSKRTGTPAAGYEDQIPEDVIKTRFDRLLNTVNSTTKERVSRFKDRVLPVLVEEEDKDMDGYLTGKTEYSTTVHFKGDKFLIGQIVPVKLSVHKGFYYLGEMTEEV